MKVYFDTEFTGLRKDTTLISIGLIAENGNTFYAEFTDYDRSQCDEWIVENVISKLLFNDSTPWKGNGVTDVKMCGDKKEVGYELEYWLDQFDEVQFVSDVCHYDMTLLIDLLAETALDLPKNISPVCYDINQDIAYFYNISQKKAFDMSREQIVEEMYGPLDRMVFISEKHNALYDAEIIKMIHEGLDFL